MNSCLQQRELLQLFKTTKEEILAQNNITVGRSKGSTTWLDGCHNDSVRVVAAEGGDRLVSKDDGRGVHESHIHLS